MSSELSRAIDELAATHRDSTMSADPKAVLGEIWAAIDKLDPQRHPLGFVHIDLSPVAPLNDGVTARFHLWDGVRPESDDLGDTHNHDWHLQSWVMYGELEDSTSIPVSNPSGQLVGSRVRYGTPNTFEAAGRFDLEPIGMRRIAAGSAYLIDAGIVHSSAPRTFPTATLVLMTKVAELSAIGPLVLSRVPPATGGTPARQSVPKDEVAKLLGSLAPSVVRED